MRSLGISTPVLNRLVFNQPVDDFITDMLRELVALSETTAGKPALCALLTEIRKDVGVDIQRNIDKIITEFTGVKTPPHLLFDLLLQMDFKQQARLVRKVMDLHLTAAFLVHAEPYCGQQLLVNRLFRWFSWICGGSPWFWGVGSGEWGVGNCKARENLSRLISFFYHHKPRRAVPVKARVEKYIAN